jgi:hypothetical protein
MVELERGNYAEHPWSEAEDFCHMRGFAVHRSRYGWWNRRSPSRQLILEEAAKVAERGCLVPPDGGAPTEAERELCEAIAAAIRSLSHPDKEKGDE